ncbi:MAG: 1,4-dihydroxy-2-naphthoate polyprenyltransferase [Acidimicrobiia bacterium]|nr:1,4-dihydroxy-2-naphthoate polyprenyltransferase [Acidimicrobiia bacterium]MYE72531.1 1,4-dihydroxy-2-naphthoate polyprenyltransferase [Acidimicrobiia bacterium]MYJ62639.1 1,4-dihydroxy-2-naphthoate polyprenyltransferase [Acidimicrobiia bacterium]
MAAVKLWIRGARPRTLPAALVPVAVGTAAAAPDVVWWRAAVALVVAVALQVGVNYANDYSDGIRGTDANRVGPARLVGGGAVAPALVKRAAFGAFGVAAVAGLVLAVVVAPWLIAVGLACIIAGWYYTGGKRPYGYAGFGELFVFVFFGLVATAGTAFVQTEELTGLAVVASVPVGFLASALLVANNLRDIPQDQAAGKRTLAVRLGSRGTAWLYAALVAAAFAVGGVLAVARSWAPLTLASLGFAIPAVILAFSSAPKAPLLNMTARLHLVFGALLTIALAVSA